MRPRDSQLHCAAAYCEPTTLVLLFDMCTHVPACRTRAAGPGLTNTITAVKNAQMAESPLVLLGGAAATVLKGRGALQVRACGRHAM